MIRSASPPASPPTSAVPEDDESPALEIGIGVGGVAVAVVVVTDGEDECAAPSEGARCDSSGAIRAECVLGFNQPLVSGPDVGIGLLSGTADLI